MHYVSNEIEKLWRQLKEMMIEYEKNTGDKRKQYEYLKEQDDAHRADVAQYPKLQTQLQKVIKSLKQDMHALSQNREQSIAELNDQIVRMRKRTESLRQIFSMNQVLDTTQLKKLTIISVSVRKVKIILNYKTFIQINYSTKKLKYLRKYLKNYYNLDWLSKKKIDILEIL